MFLIEIRICLEIVAFVMFFIFEANIRNIIRLFWFIAFTDKSATRKSSIMYELVILEKEL